MAKTETMVHDYDTAVKRAKTMAAVSGSAITVWRLLDVDTGYAVSSCAPDRASRPSVSINPDGTEHM